MLAKHCPRTEQYNHLRANEAAGDQFANHLVSSASLSIFSRSTPLSALASPDADATQYPPVEVTAEKELNIGYSTKIRPN
jgi:hypothetical protein